MLPSPSRPCDCRAAVASHLQICRMFLSSISRRYFQLASAVLTCGLHLLWIIAPLLRRCPCSHFMCSCYWRCSPPGFRLVSCRWCCGSGWRHCFCPLFLPVPPMKVSVDVVGGMLLYFLVFRLFGSVGPLLSVPVIRFRRSSPFRISPHVLYLYLSVLHSSVSLSATLSSILYRSSSMALLTWQSQLLSSRSPTVFPPSFFINEKTHCPMLWR